METGGGGSSCGPQQNVTVGATNHKRCSLMRDELSALCIPSKEGHAVSFADVLLYEYVTSSFAQTVCVCACAVVKRITVLCLFFLSKENKYTAFIISLTCPPFVAASIY